jgi:hypothetical protein
MPKDWVGEDNLDCLLEKTITNFFKGFCDFWPGMQKGAEMTVPQKCGLFH